MSTQYSELKVRKMTMGYDGGNNDGFAVSLPKVFIWKKMKEVFILICYA